MKRMLLSVLALTFVPTQSFASADCEAAPASYQALINCAESRSPDIQAAQFELESAEKQVAAAGQWKNPNISAQTFKGKVGDEARTETDLVLSVPVELGGKISAREAVAKGGVRLAEAKLFEIRARMRTEVFLKLHRLRQVIHEREIIDESIEAFSKLIGQFSRRPGLSPEQTISNSVYQLAKSDYELRRTLNLEEQVALDAYFKFALGLGVDQIKAVVPQSPSRWPVFAPGENTKASVRQQLLQADVDTSKAQFQLAKSEVWPTVSIGPNVKLVEEGRLSDQLVGFNVSLPIPVFNANGGGRAAAAAGLKTSEARKQFGLREQSFTKEALIKVYDQSVKSLSTSLNHAEIEKRHKTMENLFIRGVVPSALVIEAHRTSYDLERSRHERELKAFESLLGLYAIEGTILENNL